MIYASKLLVTVPGMHLIIYKYYCYYYYYLGKQLGNKVLGRESFPNAI